MKKIKLFENFQGAEVLLTFKDSDEPFVIKQDGKYFIIDYKGHEHKTEYTDDPQILLNAIERVNDRDYHSMVSNRAKTKEDYWQGYFDYQWSGTGGLILWHNPTEAWKSELSRRGELGCEKCGGKMTMYYKPTCFNCDKPQPDDRGQIMLIPACYYVALKNDLDIREVWEAVGDANGDYEFYHRNDSPCHLHMTGDEDIDYYLKMIDDVWPLKKTTFYVSW